MKNDIYYSTVLNEEQLAFMAGSKYGIDRMKILVSLIQCAVTKETTIKKKGFATTLHIGQVLMSEVELASKLGYDKKTISRVLDKMVQLGIISSRQNNRTSVHILHCVSAWYVDGILIRNPYYISVEQRHKDYLASDNSTNKMMNILSKESDKEITIKTDCLNSSNIPTCKTQSNSDETEANKLNSSFPNVGDSIDEEATTNVLSENAVIDSVNDENDNGSAGADSTNHSHKKEDILCND